MITNTYSISVPLNNPLVDVNNNILKEDDYITILVDHSTAQGFLIDVVHNSRIEFKPSETYIIYLRNDTNLSYNVFNAFRSVTYDQSEKIALKIKIKNGI